MKATANCRLCRETPVPSYFSSPRRCAFDSNGDFTADNWNCVTAISLRELSGEGDFDRLHCDSLWVRHNDTSYAALYVPPHPQDVPDGEQVGPFRGGGFITMSWYKHRGCTDIMIRVDPRNGGTLDKAGLPLTMKEAEAALENLKIARSESIVPTRK